MQIATKELGGRPLNYVLCLIDGYDEGWLGRNGNNWPDYLSDYNEGGRLSERECISVHYQGSHPRWLATTPCGKQVLGGTEMEAKMRAVVLKHRGEMVDVPLRFME